MSLIASKLEASLVLEGELSDRGLVALSDAGDSMFVELARALVGQLKTQSLEEQFQAYRRLDVSTARPVTPKPSAGAHPTRSPRSFPPKPLGRLVGEMVGMKGATLSGRLHREKLAIAEPESSLVCIHNRRGKLIGFWSTASMTLNDLAGTEYRVVPDSAFPGMIRFCIYEAA